MEYPKIETLFNRDPETFRVTDELRKPEFGLIKHWLVTEKIDGMNCRIVYLDDIDGFNNPGVVFYGRTERAQFTADQKTYLKSRFPDDLVQRAVTHDSGPPPAAVVYGELYGGGIQSGGWYRKDLGFRVFDVAIYPNRPDELGTRWWLNWDQVTDVARKLGAETVPMIALSNATETIVEHLIDEPSYTVALDQGARPGDDVGQRAHEGVVARTDPLLFDRKGDRIMWKLKGRDYTGGKR